ncbi:hypothetical protein RYX36_014986 [Vicia faba]
MPQMESFTIDDEAGKGRTDCDCEYRGSIRCVILHIMEEGDKLFKTFGIEKFKNWGLLTWENKLLIGNDDHEDDDSVAEYPVYQDDTFINNDNDNHLEDYEDDFVEDETCAANGFRDHTKRNIDPVEMHHPNGPPHLNQPQDQSVWQDSRAEKVKHDHYTSHNMGVASRETIAEEYSNCNWKWCAPMKTHL